MVEAHINYRPNYDKLKKKYYENFARIEGEINVPLEINEYYIDKNKYVVSLRLISLEYNLITYQNRKFWSIAIAKGS